MVARMFSVARLRKKAGNVAVLVAAAALTLGLFIGLVIESGFVYGKKAQLAKAVDAAALAAAANTGQGHPQAAQIARNVFTANYWNPDHPGQNAQPPAFDVQFQVLDDELVVTVRAEAYLRPLFINLLGAGDNFSVAATASAQRAKLVMSLVLDRSQSMLGNGGWDDLGPAVDTFVSYFDDATDRMSLTTFSSTARVDVTMRRPFKDDITAAVPRDPFDFMGFTFTEGGLELARQQNENTPLPPGDDGIKIVVLFTDGMANTFQDTFTCPPPGTLLNVTSGDSTPFVSLMNPTSGATLCNGAGPGTPFTCCPQLTNFLSITNVTRDARDPAMVRLEGRDRALFRAERIRRAGSIVYTIGLGTVASEYDFLEEIANDPRASNYDPSQPEGEFVLAPTPADLQAAFIRIARKILIRISA